jgi:hypothetical protein
MMCPYGSGWMIVFSRFGSSNVVRSPGFAPATGSRRALSGFDNFADSVETSPTMRASGLAVTSPGNGARQWSVDCLTLG